MSLKSYCEENNRQRILDEWDAEKNLLLTLTSSEKNSKSEKTSTIVEKCGNNPKSSICSIY